MINKQAKVEHLIDKAAEARTADDALKFSQAACNLANAIARVNEDERETLRGR